MRHSRAITSLAFSPDGMLLASGGMDNTTVVWDLHDDRKIAKFLHKDVVNSVSFSPDGMLLATGSWDKTAAVWTVSYGRKIVELRFLDWVRSVSFSPDVRYIACGGEEEIVVVCDIYCGKNIAKFYYSRTVFSVSFNPGGKFLATGAGNESMVWDVSNGQKLAVFPYPSLSVSFSPDGRYLACGTMIIASIRVAEWKKSHILRIEFPETEFHEGGIHNISWHGRFPTYCVVKNGVYSPFAEMPDKYALSMGFSRRGFLAIGYENGRIEIIREGKEI